MRLKGNSHLAMKPIKTRVKKKMGGGRIPLKYFS
jgi:hypothetical protein